MNNPNLVFYTTPIFHDSYITHTNNINEIEVYFPIHKVLLASKSEVFKTLFKNYPNPILLHPEDQKPVYYIGGNISPKIIDYFLQYFYLETHNVSKYYVKIIESNHNILDPLCYLFEKYYVENYKSFMTKSFKHVLDNNPEYINDLIDTCMIYGLDQILMQLINDYITNEDSNCYLDLHGKHSNVVNKLIMDYIETYINGHVFKYNKCNYLSKHHSMTTELRYDLFTKVNIHLSKIKYNKLIPTSVYIQGLLAISNLLFTHYDDKMTSTFSSGFITWYPLVYHKYYIGTVVDITKINTEQPMIKFTDYCNVWKLDANYIVFFHETEDGDLELITDIKPVKVLEELDDQIIIDQPISQEDIVKILDTECYYCII